MLAMARTEGLGKARPQMIKMGRDPRRVMRTVEEAFRNGDAESHRCARGDRDRRRRGRPVLRFSISRATGGGRRTAQGVGGLDFEGGGEQRVVPVGRLRVRAREGANLGERGGTVALLTGLPRAELAVLGGLQRDIRALCRSPARSKPRGTPAASDDGCSSLSPMASEGGLFLTIFCKAGRGTSGPSPPGSASAALSAAWCAAATNLSPARWAAAMIRQKLGVRFPGGLEHRRGFGPGPGRFYGILRFE